MTDASVNASSLSLSAPDRTSPGFPLHPLAAMPLYLAVYLPLSYLTLAFRTDSAVTPWYPPAGLHLALVLLYGPWAGLMVIFAAILNVLAFPGLRESMVSVAAYPLLTAAGPLIAGTLVRRFLPGGLVRVRLRGMALFVLIVLVTPALISVPWAFNMGKSPADGHEFLSDMRNFWLGDAIGILTVTPFAMVMCRPREWLREIRAWRMTPEEDPARWRLSEFGEWAAWLACTALTLHVVFAVEVLPTFHSFYLCFLLIIWIAVRRGIAGSAVGALIISFGSTLISQGSIPRDEQPNVQLFMITLTLAGLFLGAAINERRLSLGGLAEAESRLQLTLRAANIGFWEWNIQNNDVFLDRQWKRQLGCSDEELPNRFGTWEARLHPEDRGRMDEVITRYIREPWTDYEEEFRLRHQDGSYRWMLARGRLIYDPQGRPWRMVGVHVDITERKHAEQALRESEARTAAIVAAAMDAIITVDEQHRIVMFNQAAEAMFRCPAEEAIGMLVHALLPERFRGQHGEQIDRFGASGVTNRRMGALGSISGLRTCGEEFPIEASISQISRGGRRFYTVILRDITERARAEQAVRQAEQELRAHQQNEREQVEAELTRLREELVRKTRLATLGQLAGSIAHELRNPLGAVRNAAYFLRSSGNLDPAMRERHLRIIEAEVSTSDRIISDLLEMSRGKIPQKQEVDLEPVLQAVRAKLPGGPSLEWNLSLEVDPFHVYADPAQIAQVFQNLLTNAEQAMNGAGRITIQARRTGDGDVIVLEDSGPGIPEDIGERVFETLFTTKAKGTGLGLSICRQIMERHGGALNLLPSRGAGAVFELRLPRGETGSDEP